MLRRTCPSASCAPGPSQLLSFSRNNHEDKTASQRKRDRRGVLGRDDGGAADRNGASQHIGSSGRAERHQL